MAKQAKSPSELRYDLVSKDWVVVATGRARRPNDFAKNNRQKLPETKKDCPFETLDDQEHPTAAFFKGKEVSFEKGTIPRQWSAIALPNKYPAFAPGKSLRERKVGPYKVMDGVGFHEVILTKDHKKDIPQFTQVQVKELIDLYQHRYLEFKKEPLVNYISIFKNKGAGAGASVAHPHSQIMATPVRDPDIQRSLSGSAEYFKKEKTCIHCLMLEWDLKDKQRIVFETDCFTVVCPFASRVSFEIRVYPRKHSAYFERIEEHEKVCLAKAFQAALRKLSKALKDPDYNYFLHTAPADKGNHDHYHWHFEILPKTSTWAGFELSTGIEISTIEPEKAAAFLRKQ